MTAWRWLARTAVLGGVAVGLLFATTAVARPLGLLMAENLPTAAIALLAGYRITPRRERIALSTAAHAAILVGFLLVAALLRVAITEFWQGIEARGALFLIEWALGWGIYVIAFKVKRPASAGATGPRPPSG